MRSFGLSLLVLVLHGMNVTGAEIEAKDALHAVNKTRAARGLPPFRRDALLTTGAMRAAKFRAINGIEGHTSNDFSYLPRKARANAAGCAAWPKSMGWGACCTYESYRTAGAAWAIGRDGRRYMHLFVR